jgi:magnesium chelatase family protein
MRAAISAVTWKPAKSTIMILKTCVLVGLEAREATIEADVMPADESGAGFAVKCDQIQDHERRESRVRVVAALAAMGVRLRGEVRVTLPEGARFSQLDLAIALACAQTLGLCQLPAGLYCRAELGLDGALKPVVGTFAALRGMPQCSIAVVAHSNADEAEASGARCIRSQTLKETVDTFQPNHCEPYPTNKSTGTVGGFPFTEKHVEAAAKVQAAAEAGRSVLLLGYPGSGRMVMARHYHSFLTLTRKQAIGVMVVQSVAGVLDRNLFSVPFRAPHHTVSEGGMMGASKGGWVGEVSLASGGVLALDEVEEFRGPVLQAIKRAHAQKSVIIGGQSYPADFRIVASANPCPSPRHRGSCDCSGALLERYHARLLMIGELEVIRLP